MKLLNLVGINLSWGSTELLSVLLIWVIALSLIQIVLIARLIKKCKNETIIVHKTEKLVHNRHSKQTVEENVEEQPIDKPVAEQPEEAQAVEEHPVEEPIVEEAQPIEEEIEQIEDEPIEDVIIEEDAFEEEPIEEDEPIEEIQEEEAAPFVIQLGHEEQPVEEEIEEEELEEEEELDEEEELEEEEDEEEEEIIDDIDMGGTSLRPRYSYPTRIRLLNDNVKNFYTRIKNEFLSYGFKSRISKTKENFNHSYDNIARFVVRGKSLKLYIALDPNSIDFEYFHHRDVSDKKTYLHIPTMISIRSRLSAKKATELIAILAEVMGLVKKRRYQYKDFSEDLSADGLTFVEKKGYGYLKKDVVTLEDVEEMPDELAERLTQTTEAQTKINRFIRTRVALGVLARKFRNGEAVTIEAVRAKGIGAANANCLIVEDGKSINKKLTIYADEFSPNAVKMIVLCGGEAIKIER